MARQSIPGNSGVVYCEQFATLQACHDALPSTGGMMILAANTVYRQFSTLNINKDSVTVMGAGIGSSVIQRQMQTGDLVASWGAGFRISGVTLDGAGIPNVAEELALLGPNPVVDGIEVKNNASIAIGLATSGARIVHSQIIGLGDPNIGSMGIWFDSNRTSNLVISENVIKDQRINGIFGSGRNIEISRNYLAGNHRQIYPTGGGQICITGFSTNSNISIVGNTVEVGGGRGTSGLEIDGPGVNIVWNYIRGQQLFGIILQSGYGHQVVGNTVVNSGTSSAPQPGIFVNPGIKGFKILGNRAYDDRSVKTQSWGINVSKGPSSDYVIAGNDTRGNIRVPGVFDGGYGANRQVYGNF